MRKKKILFLGQFPPPWHGVSAINTWILGSDIINKVYEFIKINLTTAKSIEDIGRFSVTKYLTVIKLLGITSYHLIFNNPKLCYITITPTGKAFFKDSLVLLVLKLFRKTIIVHFHGKGVTHWVNSKPGWLKSYYSFIMKNTHLIVLGSRLVDDVKLIYKDSPIVIPNGIHLVDQEVLSKPTSNGFNILFLSNLLVAKGILDFLESIRMLHVHDKNFKAHIIGGTGDISIANVKQLISEHNLTEHIDVLGPKYDHEKHQYLADSDVLVFPSHNESFGLVLLEAMQFGLPIIATNEGSIPEIVEDNVNGFIIPPKSPDDITSKLLLLMENPELRKFFSHQNKLKFNSKYTFSIFEKRLLSVFNKVTS